MLRFFPVIITLCLFFISACTTQQGKPVTTLRPVNTLVIDERISTDKNYDIGKMRSAYVGEPVIRRKSYRVKTQSSLMATPLMDIVLNAAKQQLVLYKGQHYPVKFEADRTGIHYSVFEVIAGEEVYNILYDKNGTVHSIVLKRGLELPDHFQVTPLNAKITETRPEQILSNEMLENFEIIFGGITNSQINLAYREYTADDQARTAFFQELTYPIDSEYIRYRNMKIKLHNVSPEALTYEVTGE